jgi:hypothetical protein
MLTSVHADGLTTTYNTSSYNAIVSPDLCGGLKHCYEIDLSAKTSEKTPKIDVLYNNLNTNPSLIKTTIYKQETKYRPVYEWISDVKCENTLAYNKNTTKNDTVEVCKDNGFNKEIGMEAYYIWLPIEQETFMPENVTLPNGSIAKTKAAVKAKDKKKEKVDSFNSIDLDTTNKYRLEFETTIEPQSDGTYGSVGKWSIYLNGILLIDPWFSTSFVSRRVMYIVQTDATRNFSFNVSLSGITSGVVLFSSNGSGTESQCNGWWRVNNDTWSNERYIINCSLAIGNTSVWVYYNNNTAVTNQSNITNGCTFGDHFTSLNLVTTWQKTNASVSAVNLANTEGILNVTDTAGTYEGLETQAAYSFKRPMMLETYQRNDPRTSDIVGAGFAANGSNGWKTTLALIPYYSTVAIKNYYPNLVWGNTQLNGYNHISFFWSNTQSSMSINSSTNFNTTSTSPTTAKRIRIGGGDISSSSSYVDWICAYDMMNFSNITITGWGTESNYTPAPVVNTSRISPSPNAFTSDTLFGYCNATASTSTVSYFGNWYINGTFYSVWATPTGYCYQETATTATICGGLATGSYSCSGVWNAAKPCANTYDGDWATYGVRDVAATVVYVNYTKPASATNNSLWQIDDASGTFNFTIPSTCWNYNPTKLMFEIGSGAGGAVDWNCFDGSWQSIYHSAVSSNIYEEAMYWDFAYMQGVETQVANLSASVVGLGGTIVLECNATDGTQNATALNSTATSVGSMILNAQHYDATANETTTHSFNLSVNTTVPMSGLTANMTYNGTIYPSTLVWNNASMWNFSVNVSLPLIQYNNTNHSFYWTYGWTSETQTSSTLNQTIYWAYYINATSANNSQIIEGEPIASEANISTLGIATINGVFVNFNSVTNTMANTGGYVYDYTLTAPEQTPDTTLNTSYMANFSLNVSYGGTSYLRYYSKLTNYTVSNLFITTNCTSPPYSPSIAFVFYDQDTLLPINAAISVSINLSNYINTSFSRVYSFSNTTPAANMTLCLYPSFGNGTINTNSLTVSTGYASKTFVLTNEFINTTLRVFPLYLPNSTTYKFTFINLYDAFGVKQQFKYIKIYQYYPANNSYILVSSVQTDSFGQTGAYLRPIDTYYNFVVYDIDGITLLKNFTPNFIACEPAATSCVQNLYLELNYLTNAIVTQSFTPSNNFYSTPFTIGYTLGITNGTFNSFGMTITKNVNGTVSTVYSASSTNATGGSLSYLASSEGTYTVVYFYTISGELQKSSQQSFVFGASSGAQSAKDKIGTQSLITGWGYYFIAVVAAMLVGGFVSRYSFEGAGLASIFVLAIATWLNPNGVLYHTTSIIGDVTILWATTFTAIMTGAVMYLRQYY